MAKSNRYTLKFRRRREGKTDYKKRLSLLRSRQPRLVIRKSNSHTQVQVVGYTPDGDKVIASASTNQLEGLGWKGSTSNIPAAYLCGYLAGSRAVSAKTKTAIVDIGMQHAHHGGRLFAAAQGAKDAGMNVSVSEDAIPSQERLNGEHIDKKLADTIEKIKSKAGKK